MQLGGRVNILGRSHVKQFWLTRIVLQESQTIKTCVSRISAWVRVVNYLP